MMRHLFLAAAIAVLSGQLPAGTARVLFDFSDPAAMRGWQVEDDVVMGGRSRGGITRDPAGHAVFSGKVSLENDGGFSSIQNHFDAIDVSAFTHAVIRLKGDGRSYRFIVEAEKNARHHYVAGFDTDGSWQEIRIPLRTMYPVRRGDRLKLPDFPCRTLAQVRFMIANARAEPFELRIAEIRLE
jgi:NADH dehydrogenase [ubiquinone] 1 alpha subcomplex assembly factor 1